MAHRPFFLALLLLAAVIFTAMLPAAAMKDPSAVYCSAMGYTYTVTDTPDGPCGVCVLPDGTMADSFRFLQGSEGMQYSWCAREGYRQQVVTSYRTCGHFGLDQCLVCTLPDGTTREVTQLMNLSFAETYCGDRSCGRPENYRSCSADCPSGGWDDLCDGARDGRCDPDCLGGRGDADCADTRPSTPAVTFAAGIPVLAIAGAGICRFLAGRRP